MKKLLIEEIENEKDEVQAQHLQRFFKTGKGQYGEGDIFLGLTVPTTRSIVKKHWQNLNLQDIDEILKNKYHEIRLAALMALVNKFESSKNDDEKERIIKIYTQNLDYINNWDLVDLSCPKILGRFCFEKNDYELLYNLAGQNHLWANRIAVISTLYPIKKGMFEHTIKLAELFIENKHDLMQKAVGWMLREVGKKDLTTLRAFLDKYHKTMPRTMLRYSIEKLSEDERKFYMAK